MDIKELMIKPVFLKPNDEIKKIISKLKKEDTNVCIVVDENKNFLGEIHQADLIKIFLPKEQIDTQEIFETFGIGYDKKFFAKTAKDLMNKHEVTVNLQETLGTIVRYIYLDGIQYIPVIDKNNKVKGVITESSFLNYLQKQKSPKKLCKELKE